MGGEGVVPLPFGFGLLGGVLLGLAGLALHQVVHGVLYVCGRRRKSANVLDARRTRHERVLNHAQYVPFELDARLRSWGYLMAEAQGVSMSSAAQAAQNGDDDDGRGGHLHLEVDTHGRQYGARIAAVERGHRVSIVTIHVPMPRRSFDLHTLHRQHCMHLTSLHDVVMMK